MSRRGWAIWVVAALSGGMGTIVYANHFASVPGYGGTLLGSSMIGSLAALPAGLIAGRTLVYRDGLDAIVGGGLAWGTMYVVGLWLAEALEWGLFTEPFLLAFLTWAVLPIGLVFGTAAICLSTFGLWLGSWLRRRATATIADAR